MKYLLYAIDTVHFNNCEASYETGIELIDKGIARNGYQIIDLDGNDIGVITSGTLSPTLSKAIAMGYIQKDFSNLGTEFFVKRRKKLMKAKAVSLPFVKS